VSWAWLFRACHAEVLPAIQWPVIIGFKQETIDGIFVVPTGKYR